MKYEPMDAPQAKSARQGVVLLADQLGQQVITLNDLYTRLIDRLDPLLLSSVPTETADVPSLARDERCGLGHTLLDVSQRLDLLTSRMHDTLARLDI